MNIVAARRPNRLGCGATRCDKRRGLQLANTSQTSFEGSSFPVGKNWNLLSERGELRTSQCAAKRNKKAHCRRGRNLQ